MAKVVSQTAKCSPEECRHVAREASTIHPVLDDPQVITQRARVVQALGNETRLKILGLLSMRELCTCDIASALGAAASTLAHHLRMLVEAELIAARQEGKFTLYSLNAALIRRHRVLETRAKPSDDLSRRGPDDDRRPAMEARK